MNNNSCNNNNNNKNNNNNYHETLFWKVFRNIYIRNNILSKIINNNQSHYSYNGTTSLELLIRNSKLHIILDKLKTNHHLHIDCILDWDQQRTKIKDPYYKSITNEIEQLFLLNYSYIKNDLLREIGCITSNNQNTILERYKLFYPNNKNNYNNYMAHSLLYKILNIDSYYINIQLIQYLNQHINNNNTNNNTNKIQNINNNTNDKKEYFIQQLISTSSSSTSSSSSTILKLENEVIEAIYNDQTIPTHINQYYSNKPIINLYHYYNQDLYENQLKVDVCSILLNLNQNAIIIGYNKEMLELILLKLLYHQHTIKLESSFIEIKDYPVNSIIHAKIYFLNKLNGWKDKDKQKAISSILKFKQHLINNQVNTLDELILVARDSFDELDYEQCFGPYYYYYLINSNQLDKYSFKSHNFSILLLNYSIITQQTELFDKYIKLSKGVESNIEYFISARSSIGFSNNNNQLIKDKSTIYFNHIFKELSRSNHEHCFQIFKMIINSYNSKLFEWLLESNKELKDLYHGFIGNIRYFIRFFLIHTRIDIDSDQVDYEMLDVLIKHIKIMEFPEDHKLDSNIGLDRLNISNQRNVKILNHLIKSPSNNNNKLIHSIISALFNGFKELNIEYETIKIYDQIDQQLLFNYYSSINDNQHQYSKLAISTYQNKSSILVPLLIQSIIKLDFNSINKIVSATFNNNINIKIPTTFNNSLDIIKYLISNQYLKEFSLYYILDQIISNIQVDREFIMELIQLSKNNEINNKITTTTTSKHGIITLDELILEFEHRFDDIDQKIKDQLETNFRIRQIRNDFFGLSTLEKIKHKYENTKDFTFINGTELERYSKDEQNEILCKAIDKHYSVDYYNAIYQFLNNNKDLDLDFNSLILLKTNNISIEWFSKLYPVLFKNVLISTDKINQHSYHNPPEIFEFIWNNHFKNNEERVNYITQLLTNEYYYKKYDPLIKYLFKTKREFITTSVILDQAQLFKLHQFILYYNNMNQLYHQVRSTFPSFNFEINLEIFKTLYKENRYQTIEYLFENNLIPNLEQIIGTEKLNNLRIKEYYYDNWNSDIYISKSMFILIHTIIKLQKQQQQQQ